MKPALLVLALTFLAHAQDAPRYDRPFFPGATYDDKVPAPEKLLGFRVGERAARHAEIERCFKAWAEASPRARLVRYGASHEGRALYYLIVTSPDNLARLADIQKAWNDLAAAGEAAAEERAASVPAVAWMAYSIHGDETSGSDAALAVAHHLAAGQGDDVEGLLNDLVVILDPMMNPDGRDRFLQMVREHRGRVANVDNQSLLHAGYWPRGRTNHYLFDLNRDWILAVHPETRGRLEALQKWHPLLFVDAHEMGSLDTYLFNPPREPINPNVPGSHPDWWLTFAKDQGTAFDAFGWRYYTREWVEEWYPGYTSAWAGYRGAIGILYEQANIVDAGVKRPEGTIQTYGESVHHQVVSTMANLRTLKRHRRALTAEFAKTKREAVAADGPYAKRVFAFPPSPNRWRQQRFFDMLRLQGFSIRSVPGGFTTDAVDRLGVVHKERAFAAGTLVVPNRQPLGHLVAAMLEFDPRMTDAFLGTERRELLRFGRSRLYDVTAWSLPLMHDVEAYVVESAPAGRPAALPAFTVGLSRKDAKVAFAIDGADDASLHAAARLLESGVRVRLALKPFRFQDREFARGSLVIAHADNPGDFVAKLDAACKAARVAAYTLDTGRGVKESPDFGGAQFPLLERPRVALLARGSVSGYDFGSLWHQLDHRLGLSTSALRADGFGDLRRYNVLVVPEGGGGALDDNLDRVVEWVEGGGTLIAIGSTAAALARPDSKLSAVRRLRDVLDKLDEYEQQVMREWAGRTAEVDVDKVWEQVPPKDLDFPWDEAEEKRPEKEELERRDKWQRIFMPQGAILAGRTDDRHWLTCGLGAYVPVLFNRRSVLMSLGSVATPVRFGHFVEQEKRTAYRAGWAMKPAGYELRLRMSGLLWPEAAARIANSAYVTREGKGNGQVILFAAPPAFRGSTLGTARIFLNAVLFGPGVGANPPIR